MVVKRGQYRKEARTENVLLRSAAIKAQGEQKRKMAQVSKSASMETPNLGKEAG